jgi:hypothetical protein
VIWFTERGIKEIGQWNSVTTLKNGAHAEKPYE